MNEQVENVILVCAVVIFSAGLCGIMSALSAINENLKRIADKPTQTLYVNGEVWKSSRLTDEPASNNDRFK